MKRPPTSREPGRGHRARRVPPRSSGARVAGSRFSYTHRGYAISRTLAQFRARPIASALTLLVLGITLALPALVLFTADAVQGIAPRTIAGESLTAYLGLEIADLDGAALATRLAKRDDVAAARYVSRDEALATFRQNSDLGAALDALGANPLPGAVLVRPATDVAERVERLATSLESLDEVDSVQYDLRWVRRMEALLGVLRVAGVLLAVFLTSTALLVIGNTLRLELLRRQTEREVANLLGAGTAFLNRPLIYTGLLYGLLGGSVAVALALAAQFVMRAPVAELAALYGSGFTLPLPSASHLLLVPLVATALGLLGALLTLYGPSRQLSGSRRHS